MTMAWLTLVKTTGATPLMPGMWPKFLAIYGGLWLGAGFMRPIRLSLALGAAPYFDRALGEIMSWTKVNKIGAFAIMLVGIAAASFALLGGVLLLLGGLP
ncbi:hypothetical protein DUNSADRAFT_6918 [Dunaliella salina]|uniref:Uncharacterized protein n=1 Tax=Dunaliella salina TaxID=3046 RepID=A0ABQ7FTM0_DUNSA|nr:hypothetical protein DUNSADRAFT_6918 [Dunaliella salina]|eukprot:KAF5825796.1 hypothetical protein DUNSADRAFT_6918 [Dunaliella salina]